MEPSYALRTSEVKVGPVRLISSNIRLKALDGVRAVAIAFVVVGHVLGIIQHLDSSRFRLADGVSIFFVLSGFLITSLLLRERDTFGTVRLKQFYMRRVRRIFPVFYVFLVAMGLLKLAKVIHFETDDWLSSVAFVNNYATTRSWWLGHLWSLSIEEQFYLLWPLVIAVGGRSWGIRVALTIIALDPLVRIISYYKIPALRDHLPIMLHTRGDILMCGCILALLIGNSRFEAAMRALFRFRLQLIACAFYFIADPFLNARYGGTYYLTVGYTIQGLSLATMLFWILSWPEASIVRVLSTPPVVFVGLISYSLYLWQQPFLAPLNATFAGAFPIDVALAVATAVLSYYFIERPFLSRLRAVEPVPTSALGISTV